jgi:uncharacterized protein (TIGR02118 family)
MVKLVVAYGKPQDTDTFDAYYANTHAPLAKKIPGLRRFEYGKVIGTPDGSEPPYYFLATLYFDSPEDLQSGMASAEGRAAGDDVANFASGGATLFVAAID